MGKLAHPKSLVLSPWVNVLNISQIYRTTLFQIAPPATKDLCCLFFSHLLHVTLEKINSQQSSSPTIETWFHEIKSYNTISVIHTSHLLQQHSLISVHHESTQLQKKRIAHFILYEEAKMGAIQHPKSTTRDKIQSHESCTCIIV